VKTLGITSKKRSGNSRKSRLKGFSGVSNDIRDLQPLRSWAMPAQSRRRFAASARH
jgi:hypothetical protein